MKQGDMILIEVSGQYEFAHVHSLQVANEPKYIAVTTESGARLGGIFDDETRLQRYMHVGNDSYPLNPCTGAEPGWDSAMEHFGLGRYAE